MVIVYIRDTFLLLNVLWRIHFRIFKKYQETWFPPTSGLELPRISYCYWSMFARVVLLATFLYTLRYLFDVVTVEWPRRLRPHMIWIYVRRLLFVRLSIFDTLFFVDEEIRDSRWIVMDTLISFTIISPWFLDYIRRRFSFPRVLSFIQASYYIYKDVSGPT